MCLTQKKTKKLPNGQEFQQELIVRIMKDESFRQKLLANSKSVVEREMGKLKEGAKLPTGIMVKVIEQPDNSLYLVLPNATDELSDEALESVKGGLVNIVRMDNLCIFYD